MMDRDRERHDWTKMKVEGKLEETKSPHRSGKLNSILSAVSSPTYAHEWINTPKAAELDDRMLISPTRRVSFSPGRVLREGGSTCRSPL
jgi:hypothetical protein